MERRIASLSRPMRVGLLGSASAVGGYVAEGFSTDSYIGNIVGGAISAAVVNTFVFRFGGLGSVMMLGAISSFAGNRIARSLTPKDATDVPFRTLVGLVGGGGISAMTIDTILPPEIKLLEP